MRYWVERCEGPGGVGQFAANQLLIGDNDMPQQGAPIMMAEDAPLNALHAPSSGDGGGNEGARVER